MIFELISQPLTPAEQNLVPAFVNALKTKQGRNKAVNIEKMQTAIIQLTHIQVLKLIHHIRLMGLVNHLVNDMEGNYWIASTREEIETCMKNLKAFEDMCWKERNSLQQQMQNSWLVETKTP